MNTLEIAFAASCLACFVGCGTVDATSDTASASVTADATCHTEKMTFTQRTGCQNDGAVEFCIPKGDDAVHARLHEIQPAIECSAGHTGHIGCDLDAEEICFYPTPGIFEPLDGQCQSHHGALSDQAWSQLCDVAALESVRKLGPFFGE